MSYTDLGQRCFKHAGEVFAPRCYECQSLTAEALNPSRAREVTPEYLDGPVTCSIDNPCPQCIRDAAKA